MDNSVVGQSIRRLSMKNERLIKILEDLPFPKESAKYPIAEKESVIKRTIKAFEKLNSLTDRPCDACKYRENGMCVRWCCVFEEVDAK